MWKKSDISRNDCGKKKSVEEQPWGEKNRKSCGMIVGKKKQKT